jgi:predicted cupin superfamily sugar epimerase
MLQLHPDGTGRILTLGSDVLQGEMPQVIVPAGTWQGSRLVPHGEFALMGTTMAPGFEFTDYEAADRSMLIGRYREYTELITQLTQA